MHRPSAFGLAAFAFLIALPASLPAQVSDLWGRRGEKWSAESRLPDFSFTGYHCGEKPLPNLPRGVSVKDYGAKGDGQADDTQAFLTAIAKAPPGAIEVPAGRYKITNILEIKRPNLVLRGEGPTKTILFCPTPLQEIKPNWGATTSGQKTSNYSWSGGFVTIQGSFQQKSLAKIVDEPKRGAQAVQVSSAAPFRPGQRIEILLSDNADNSLAAHLYSDDGGDMGKLNGRTRATLVCRVIRVEKDRIHVDRPLRFDIRGAWKPEVRSFNPNVTEVGVENLGFEFPVTPYKGHFTEMGFNAITIRSAIDCWVRNIRIVNADSGLFPSGMFCTIDGVVFESSRTPDRNGSTGHHGIYLSNNDNLFTRFDYRTQFIHDITVSHCAGNVSSSGRGVDLCFDHHKRVPYENLFTDIDVGRGTHVWRCGGGAALGKHCGARGTFWNIRAQQPLPPPSKAFGPWSMNLVGLPIAMPAQTKPDGPWLEPLPPQKLIPQNLHEAQRAKRLATQPSR